MPVQSFLSECMSGRGANNRESATRLLEHFREELRRRAAGELHGRLRDKLDPADLVQDTLIRANAAFPTFKGATVKELTAWLHGIMDYSLVEFRRQYNTDKRDAHREVHEVSERETAQILRNLPGNFHTPSSIFRHKEDGESVKRLLDKLPAEYRQCVVARHWDEQTFEEISKQLGYTRPGVTKLYKRAIQMLRRMMPEWQE